MLNCGDTLIDFNIVLNNIDKIAEAVDVTFFTVSVNVLTTIPSKKVKNNIDLILSNVEIPHQGAFVKKSAYNRFGLYNENFKIRMEFSINLKQIHMKEYFRHQI